MKRVLSLCCLILLVVFMSVPVLAAEAYVFDFWDIAFFSDLANDNGGVSFFLNDLLPAGRYNISLFILDQEVSLGLFNVSFVPGDLQGFPGLVWETSLHLSVPGVVQSFCRATLFVGDLYGEASSVLLLYDIDKDYFLRAPEGSYVRFVPVELAIVSFYDFVAPVDSLKRQFSFSSLVDVVILFLSVSAGLALLWWGVRKTTSILMAALRKGKLRI